MSQAHPLIAALRPLVDALGAEIIEREDVAGSDVPLCWDDAPIAGVRLPQIHGSLDRVIAIVEAELGAPLSTLSRTEKQLAIKRLDELGAFVLRRAVDDIAAAMDMSRITVYSYLNALLRL